MRNVSLIGAIEMGPTYLFIKFECNYNIDKSKEWLFRVYETIIVIEW